MHNANIGEQVLKFKSMPGFEEDPDGCGYKFITPEGRIWVRGARLGDELVDIAGYTTLNTTKLVQIVGDWPYPTEFAISDVIHNIAKRRVDIDYAQSLTEARLKTPIVGIANENGVMDIVDGTHRLWRLNQLGHKHVFIHVLNDTVIPDVVVTYWLDTQNGMWVPFDKNGRRPAGQRFF